MNAALGKTIKLSNWTERLLFVPRSRVAGRLAAPHVSA